MDQIWDNIIDYPDVNKQINKPLIKNFNYILYVRLRAFYIKNAIKRYKVENVTAIYSFLFQKYIEWLVIFCDENNFVNGNIMEAQTYFLKKV